MSVPFQASDCVRWTGGRLLQGLKNAVLSGVA